MPCDAPIYLYSAWSYLVAGGPESGCQCAISRQRVYLIRRTACQAYAASNLKIIIGRSVSGIRTELMLSAAVAAGRPRKPQPISDWLERGEKRLLFTAVTPHLTTSRIPPKVTIVLVIHVLAEKRTLLPARRPNLLSPGVVFQEPSATRNVARMESGASSSLSDLVLTCTARSTLKSNILILVYLGVIEPRHRFLGAAISPKLERVSALWIVTYTALVLI
ncbi:hypothetical protein FIBSPDRAFT_929077 [Athelia psychrophila]|uniref:Uncharacterized protein n=1 Tax=Athelia psychrophila TaxID=1759441 RepID=A0A166PA72_9AGAM|nr:hypothetical protein FIBSPDRAFT_929077 [Fibularhizoctonia sp. CBS 109695]